VTSRSTQVGVAQPPYTRAPLSSQRLISIAEAVAERTRGVAAQVGPILVAWGGLSVQGPKGSGYITIPYENIVMWTLHLEETCLDLTLDGTFTCATPSLSLSCIVFSVETV